MSRGPGRPAGSAGQQGRDAILRATRELLGEQGTARVTLRGVAKRAGVRPPLVNYYFGTKAELFEAVIAEIIEGLRDRLADIADHPGTPEDRFRAFIAGIVHGMAADPFTPHLLAELIIFPDDERTDRFVADFARPNLDALARVIQDGIDAGRFSPIDPRVLVPAVLGSCIFYFLGAPGLRRALDFEPLDDEHVERFAHEAAELLLNGISARA